MLDLELLSRLITALGMGMLIGLERGWHERHEEQGHGAKIAGTRTFGGIALLGAISAVFAGEQPVLLGLIFISLTGLIVTAHVLATRADKDFGITTAVAALVTFALGTAAILVDLEIPAAVAVLLVTLLSMRQQLHYSETHIEARELHATFRLLLISLVILPVLPNQGMGPWQALNPYQLWWMVVLITGLSWAGYFGSKWIGPSRGLLLTGALGGLASSTAVTLQFSRTAQQHPELTRPLAAGILISATIMFPRLLLIATVVHPPLITWLLPQLALMMLTCLTAAIWILLHDGTRPITPAETALPNLQNPFELRMALGFTALLAGLVLLSHALRIWWGEAGIVMLAGVSGLADTDAITLTLAQMTNNAELLPALASAAITLAIVVNTLVKGGLALLFGNRELGRMILSITGLASILAVAGYLATAWLLHTPALAA